MGTLLCENGIWKFVDSRSSLGANRDDEAATQKSNLALAYIIMQIDWSRTPFVKRLWDPRDVWINLQDTYQSVGTSSMDAKLPKLQNIQMYSKESIVTYANMLKILVNQLFDVGRNISKSEKLFGLLRGQYQDFEVAASHSHVRKRIFWSSITVAHQEKFR